MAAKAIEWTVATKNAVGVVTLYDHGPGFASKSSCFHFPHSKAARSRGTAARPGMDFAHVAQRLTDCPIIIIAAEAANWKNDENLKNDLDRYVKQNLKRKEILDFVQKEYPEYSWSFRTLDRRLRWFNIHYSDYETPLAAVGAAVEQKLNGPGKLLGYRALRRIHHFLDALRILGRNQHGCGIRVLFPALISIVIYWSIT